MNARELGELTEQCREWSTEQLERAASVEAVEYVPEAIQVFEKELAARNVSLDHLHAVQEKIKVAQQKARYKTQARKERLHGRPEGRTMRQVYLAKDAPDAELVKAMLEEEGIPAVVFGEDLQKMLTWATPLMLPSVWILDGTDHDRASQLVSAFLAEADEEPQAGQAWLCAKCGEEVEPQFAECWNCGAERLVQK